MASSQAASVLPLDPAQDLTKALHGDLARHLEQEALPAYLPLQRWYAAKDKRLIGVTLQPWTTLNDDVGDYILAAVDLTFADGASQTYFLPLALHPATPAGTSSPRAAATVATVAGEVGEFALVDAAADPAFAHALLRRLQLSDDVTGPLRCEATDALKRIPLPPPTACRRPTKEQSNISFVMGDALLFKLYRRLRPGVQPEIEVSRFLTQAGFANTPPYLGAIAYAPPGGADLVPIAAAFGFVANRGNAWDGLLPLLREELAIPTAGASGSLDLVRMIGGRTADMHCAFAAATEDPAFAIETVTADDLRQWSAHALDQAERAFAAAQSVGGDPNSADSAAADIDALLSKSGEIRSRIERFAALPPSGVKTRHHGDYHLGQVLVGDGDVYIIDFEGEPLRSLEERRAKTDPARDLAGMLRSFDYLAATATEGTGTRARAQSWREAAEAQFLQAYAERLKACGHGPTAAGSSLDRLELFLFEKALYEIRYEAANRPGWIGIPVAGALRLLDEA
jgi:maltose alpha-D-glucosyltransferase/alpha-amylase